jgi:O-antigen/teichoic acid export membrane protein
MNVARTRLLGIVDQAASSVSNVAITVVAARALDRQAFGGFVLVMAVYVVLIGLTRAVALEPLLIRGADRGVEPLRDAAGAAVAMGTVLGVGCVAAGLLAGDATGRALVVLGLFLPLLFLQDGWRYAAFALERPQFAITVDAAWLATQAAGTVALVQAGSQSPAAFVALWAASGAVGAVVGVLRARVLPRVTSGVRRVAANLDLGGPFVVEFLADGGAAYAALWLLGILSGLDAVGAIRVGQTVFGPINVLYVGMFVTLVPEGARRLREGPHRLRTSMIRASVVVSGVAAMATLVALAVPGSVGRALFGDSWDQGHSVLLALGVALCGGGVMTGATAGLRALGRARRSLAVRLATLPLMLGLPLVGAVVADEVGFGVGIATATWLAAGLWWAAFSRALAARDGDDSGDQRPEDLDEGASGLVPGELAGPFPPGLHELGPPLRMADDVHDGVGEVGRSVGVEEDAGAAHHLGQGGPVGDDDRDAAGHGLQRSETETLGP